MESTSDDEDVIHDTNDGAAEEATAAEQPIWVTDPSLYTKMNVSSQKRKKTSSNTWKYILQLKEDHPVFSDPVFEGTTIRTASTTTRTYTP